MTAILVRGGDPVEPDADIALRLRGRVPDHLLVAGRPGIGLGDDAIAQQQPLLRSAAKPGIRQNRLQVFHQRMPGAGIGDADVLDAGEGGETMRRRALGQQRLGGRTVTGSVIRCRDAAPALSIGRGSAEIARTRRRLHSPLKVKML